MILCTRGTGGMTAVGRIVAESPTYGDCPMARKIIKIERYEARPAGHNRTKWYAIAKDGKEYEMPDAFVNGYTDDYLAIEWTTSEMPEVLDLPPEGFYIPIRTAPLKAAKS